MSSLLLPKHFATKLILALLLSLLPLPVTGFAQLRRRTHHIVGSVDGSASALPPLQNVLIPDDGVSHRGSASALFTAKQGDGRVDPIASIPSNEAAPRQNLASFGVATTSKESEPGVVGSLEQNPDQPALSRIALGGGCHWCTEGVFVSLCGVGRVEQGWVSSVPPQDAFSEAVIVYYDPTVISPEDLLGVHLETHAATKNHALRHRYRSAVYFFGSEDEDELRDILKKLAKDYADPILTQVLPFVAFKASLPEHRDYYRKDPNKPFCQRFIAPKLAALRKSRPSILAASVNEGE